MSLHQSSRDSVDGDGLEIGRRGDELEDVIDVCCSTLEGFIFGEGSTGRVPSRWRESL
jgi:hypothetical protein